MIPGLDVVVTNYQTWGDLEEFLESFERVRREIPCRLNIANVAPRLHDKTVVDAFRQNTSALVRPIDFDENVGYARACNGSSFGMHDALAFFNADTVLKPGVLKGCYDFLFSDPDLGIVGPKQVDQHGRITAGGIFAEGDRSFYKPDRGQCDDVRTDALSVAGSAYFIKRACWEELTDCAVFQAQAPGALGAFLPTRHYYEETWCSLHARDHGWGVGYLGSVSMIHKWHQASPLGGWAEQQAADSRRYFQAACEAHAIDLKETPWAGSPRS